MKIRTTVENLNQAFEIAGIVTPKLKNNSDAAFLIANHGGKLYVHSHDGIRATRTELKFDSLEGEGAFAFPNDKVGSLKYVDGWIELESGHDDKRHWVKYTTEGGAKVDIASYDPDAYATLVRNLSETTEERLYLTAILRDAFKTVFGFTPRGTDKDKAPDFYSTLQIFDASKPEWLSGDGVMLGADGTRAAFFSCEALKGKGLGVHTDHLSYLTDFLAKCGPTVKVKFGEAMNFLIELIPEEDGTFTEGAVIGWVSHVTTHAKYKYYATSEDHAVLMVPRDMMVKSLSHIRSLLSGNQPKIRLILKDGFLNFKSNDGGNSLTSAPVGVDLLALDDKSPSVAGFECNADADRLVDLFSSAKGHEVEFRIALVAESKHHKSGAFFRTFDRFRLNTEGAVVISPEDSYECLVTRFTPSV